MTFKRLSEYFKLLEENTSRLKITEILADMFKETNQDEIEQICYLSLGRLLPAYRGIEFQMADKMMQKAVARAFGLELEIVSRRSRESGDLGTTAKELKVEFKNKKQTQLFGETKIKTDPQVAWVYDQLMLVAKESGIGSVESKVEKMANIIESLDSLGVCFVVRMPLGRMRLGFSEMTILDALSWMVKQNKSLRPQIEDAYNLLADVGEIAKIVKKDGAQKLAKIKPKLGTPVIPALCQRIDTAEEIIKKLGESAVEPKYDGARLQVHISSKEVQIFTRNLENVTHMFPDIVQAVKTEVKKGEMILDGEGVGVDPKTNHFLPFQETIKRKRKYDIGQAIKEIPLKYFVFDILFLDGESLLKTPLSQRRKILESVILKNKKIIKLSPQIVTKDPQVLRRYHQQQIKDGLEGVVVKKFQSDYDPGRRGFTWVKLKQEITKKGGGLADTIDCLVMGVSRGRGKRANFGVGSFLVGIKNQDGFVSLTNIGTGLTDEQFRALNQKSRQLEVTQKPKEYLVVKNQEPDIWLRPELVVEIQADNITQSTAHTAGLALRFPRLIRFREEKSAAQVTDLQEVKRLFSLQKSR